MQLMRNAGIWLLLGACGLVACHSEQPQVSSERAPEQRVEVSPVLPESPSSTVTPATRALTAPEQVAVQAGIPRKIDEPSPATETPPLAPVAELVYVCESGTPLRVSYRGIEAHVVWTEARTLNLSRDAQYTGSGEQYRGDGHVLLRRGSVVELRAIDGRYDWRCAESSASA